MLPENVIFTLFLCRISDSDDLGAVAECPLIPADLDTRQLPGAY